MYSFPNPQTSPTKLEIQTLETCLVSLSWINATYGQRSSYRYWNVQSL